MELKQLLQLDDSTILKGSDNEGRRYLGVMLSYYSQVFGETCSGCSSKHPFYLQKLRNFVMKKKEIKKGDFPSEVYSNSNLTDEIALKILSKNPNAISVFKTKPKDWEDQVEAYKAGQTEVKTIDDLAKLTVKAIKVLFPDSTGKTKEEMIKDIAEKYPQLVNNPELVFDIKEGDIPAIGDTAKIGETPANGEFIFPEGSEGKIYVIENGVIKEIKDQEPAE